MATPFDPTTYFEILPFDNEQTVIGRNAHKAFAVAGGRTAEVYKIAKAATLTEGSIITGLMRIESAKVTALADGATVAAATCLPNAIDPGVLEITGLNAAAADYLIIVIGTPRSAGL